MKEIEKEFEISADDFPEKNLAAELGNRLRAAREAKNLNYRDLSETTRLRPRFLEALERGDWDGLPSPALARGFIATYARALGLDAAGLIERHGDALPDKRSPFTGIVSKRPVRKIRLPVLLMCLVLIGVAGALVMLWRGGGGPEISSDSENTTPPVVQTPPTLSETENVKNVPTLESEGSGLGEKDEALEVASIRESAVDQGESSISEPGSEVPGGLSEEQSGVEAPVPEERDRGPEMPSTDVPDQSGVKILEEADRKAEKMPFTLKAYVKERTWMRITVDNGQPREYIFSPGNEPEWEARGKFDLLIGNAGGLFLELNGKKIGALGASGQVVRVRLPETVE
jgi:cytoskeleton protein RodZ